VRGAAVKGAEAYRAMAAKYDMQLAWVFVNAKDHGLPQERKRVFIVFTRGGVFVPEFEPQRPVYAPEILAGAPACPPPDPNLVRHATWYKITAQDVLRCIPLMKPGQAFTALDPKVLKKVSPKIAKYLVERKDHMPFGGGSAQLVRCPIDKPTRTVFGVGVRFVHPTEDRLLTMAELMRLTGYPDGFPWFESNMGEQSRTMGKSVCPPVGEWIASEVAAHLRGERDVRHVREATFWCATDKPPRITKEGGHT
jgi:site-specific DNA-cytosine methylase